MGKKRKFNRFIRWIKSDLPDDNKSVLLLGVTKLPSPTPVRARPHTLHLDHHLEIKSQTLDNQPRLKPRPLRSYSNDSLNELLTVKFKCVEKSLANNNQPKTVISKVTDQNNKFTKKVSFDTEKNATASCIPINSSTTGCFNKNTVGNGTINKLELCAEHLGWSKKYSHTDDGASQDFMMDKSVDSIGSCSLDVDASSTDFSDSSVGSSDCTLRSIGVITPTTQPSATVVPTFHLDTTSIASVERKKPSYLNLACTVNGYSNITNYDSKLRENFRIPRSREVSPIRPQDYNGTNNNHSIINNNNTVSENGDTTTTTTTTCKSKFLTSGYQQNNLLQHEQQQQQQSPVKMSESKSQSVLRATSYSYSSKITSSSYVIGTGVDTVDKSPYHNHHHHHHIPSIHSSPVQSNGFSSKFLSSQQNGKGTTTTTTTESYESTYSTITNGSSSGGGGGGGSNETNTKSFIQQRVERLYGPGALAQGFFISKRLNKSSTAAETADIINNSASNNSSSIDINNRSFNTISHHSNIELIDNDVNSIKQSCSSPALPVLRHLRPEFRAQLSILSPKRSNIDNLIQKSTTVPSSLTNVANITNQQQQQQHQNGIEKKSPLLNGSTQIASENKENIINKQQQQQQNQQQQQQQICLTQIFDNNKCVKLTDIITDKTNTEEIPAAPQVLLPVAAVAVTATIPATVTATATATATITPTTNGNLTKDMVLNGTNVLAQIPAATNNGASDYKREKIGDNINKDGHYFLQTLQSERNRLLALADEAEKESEAKKDTLTDEQLGHLLAASGKARLLASQKMQQFEGLCHKNINQEVGEPFPTTSEDLEGFWDMVMLQVVQIDELFQELNRFRANNWIIEEKPKTDTMKPKKIIVKKTVTAEMEAQRKQREAERKKMIEERRRKMRETKKAQVAEQPVEIFVPDLNTSSTSQTSIS